ncbi:MAG TPA: PAS domain S-box protein [Rhodocyclaceae bacterium]|nr:PAS domain S-box protein [Rhodocyclaceae bacterium]
MSPPRQALSNSHAHASGQPTSAGESRDRRTSGDRRTAERRHGVYPFESREARLRFAAQAAGFGTYDLDCASGESVWSPELRTMAGLSPTTEPLTAEQAESLIHPEDRSRFQAKLKASLEPAGSGEFEDEVRILRPDGSTRWVRAKGRTFFVGEGSSRWPLAATGVVMDITASRAAERALAESREEMDNLVDAAIDSIITIDADQRIIRFNPSAARMFGYRAEEMMGSGLEPLMPERYRAAHAGQVREFAKAEAPAKALKYPQRLVGLRANGEEFPFEASIIKVNVDGSVRMTTCMRDITDRVRAEEALRRSKEDLELAIRGANIGIWSLDLASRRVEWSERQYQLFGIAVGDAIGYERVMAAIHPNDREEVVAAAARAKQGQPEYRIEYRVVWPDGSTRWLESIGSIFYDASGQAATMRGITIDITDRRAIEEALQRSKDDLELALRGADIGVWHWDARNNHVELSDRCRQLFGIPASDPLSFDRVLAAIHPDDRESVKELLRESLEKREEYRFEKRFLWPDGSLHWLECIGRDLYDEKTGQPVGIRGVSIDVTERKRFEEALQQSKEHLEGCVRERTDQLLQANEALERSNMELRQFAFIAAHDLQTPLRSINGFAQLLQREYRGRLDGQADAWLDQVVRSAQRMHELIRDVLTYSRLESGGRVFEAVEFNQVFADVVQSLDAAIREAGGTVTRDELPAVLGDRTQLGQVLQNLVDNGLKYRGDEPPRVHVSAARSGEEWVFSVRDNGIGIAEKHQERIFEIFRRLHTQQEYSGTGIGLAICRRIVQRHGGRIWVESRPGQGSAFHFSLPVRPAPQP